MLIKVEFKPGIVKDDSTLAAEGTFVGADKVRFLRGRAQVVGGWERASSETFSYPCRGAAAWAALSGDRTFAFGTADKLLTFYGGALTDITPLKFKTTLTNPFSVTNGSATVTVSAQDHGLKPEDSVTFALADAVGGITVNGTYSVVSVIDIDKFTITHGSNASSTATGGGNVEVTATLDMGRVDGIGGTGWGTGTYGTGYYGLPTGGDIYPRTWAMDNWGGYLLAVPRGGALYEWQPSASYPNLLGTTWTLGTGWASDGTATAGAASDYSQDLTGIISGGVTYEVVFTVSRSAGSLQMQVVSNPGSPTTIDYGAAISKSGTYTRRFTAPASPTLFQFHKDASFAGSVTSVTLKVVEDAYRIQSAPQYSTGMFVDPNRIVVCYGTVEADGDYNPLLVRWSAQEDNKTWLANSENLAGEYVLARGSRIVGGMATRGQNLIWTDDALYTMRFTGNTGDVFSFSLVGTGCGLLGKNAAAEINGMAFWWGRNGQFYIFRGGEPQIIDCPVRKDAWDNMAFSQEEKVYCGVNSEFNEIWWFYPDARDGNECSRYVAYNYAEDHWTVGTFNRTAWIGAGVYANPIGFGTDGLIYYHERGDSADGAAIPWTLETGYFDVEDGGNLFRVSRYMPDFEEQTGAIALTIDAKDAPNGSERSYGPFTLTTSTKTVGMRALARQMALRFAGSTNAGFARLGVQRFDVEKSGALR